MFRVRKIISGGQTGVDRAALDFALENGIETGGYVPKGRLAEDGHIPNKYSNLIETGSEDHAERTRLNVMASDATLILSQGVLSGGSRLTKEAAENYQKPFLHLDLSVIKFEKAIDEAKEWLDSVGCETLNVAGPRAPEDPEIYLKTKQFLNNLLGGE
jgi:hypothetical protein